MPTGEHPKSVAYFWTDRSRVFLRAAVFWEFPWVQFCLCAWYSSDELRAWCIYRQNIKVNQSHISMAYVHEYHKWNLQPFRFFPGNSAFARFVTPTFFLTSPAVIQPSCSCFWVMTVYTWRCTEAIPGAALTIVVVCVVLIKPLMYKFPTVRVRRNCFLVLMNSNRIFPYKKWLYS